MGQMKETEGVSFLCARYVLTVSIALLLLVLSPFVYSCVCATGANDHVGLFFCSKTEQLVDKI